jgi:hypothetical protein
VLAPSATSLSRADLLPDAQDLHGRIIGTLDATRPLWLRSNSLLDAKWVVSTQGMSGFEVDTLALDFGAVIAPGGGRLTDPAHQQDLVTAKVVAFHLLQDCNEGSTVQTFLQCLAWFFRWRLDRAIYATRDLTPAFFEDFARALKGQGRTALIDYGPRIDRYKSAVLNGTLVPGFTTYTGYGNRPRVDLQKVAPEIGTHEFQNLPPAVRLALLEFLEAQGYPLRAGPLARARRSAECPERPVGRGAVLPMLQVWSHLWDYRAYLQHDPLQFDPFKDSSLHARLDSLAANPGRTATIPARQACFLADRALRWVTEYSGEILRLLKKVEPILAIHPTKRHEAYAALVRKEKFSGPGAPRIFHDAYWHPFRKIPTGEATLHDIAFRLLPTACAIVIAMFSARRKREVQNLRDGCVVQDDLGRDWLETWVEKTIHDFERIPTPASVNCAVKVLSQLSAPARERHGRKALFNFIAPHWGYRVAYDFGDGLPLFASFCKVPALPSGEPWHFKPHQFRRFLSVIYDRQYKYSSLTALSAFLKHFDTSRTRTYTTDVTQGELARLREEADSSHAQSSRYWYKKITEPGRRAEAQARAARSHLPFDWMEAVTALERQVDVLSPRAGVTPDSFNALLESEALPATLMAKRRSG